MIPWCAPSCPPRRSFVASDARRRGQLCTVPTRPDSTYKSGKAVQRTGATSNVGQAMNVRNSEIMQISLDSDSNRSVAPVFDEVVLLCPEACTGGPEAIHQLAHAINSQGGSAKLAYFEGESKVSLDNSVLRCELPTSGSPTAKSYASYAPKIFSELKLTKNVLLVFPEVVAAIARNVQGCQRAVWWLSVDNALRKDPRLENQSFRNHLFSDPALIHFYQSDYARDFLLRNRARRIYPIFDYTDKSFAPPLARLPGAKIAYFPSKGGELARRFVQGAPDLQFSAIANMTREQVRQTLQDSSIFIDFGNQPGKDRVPREAAASGAIVLLHERGAANFFTDHPLDEQYLFGLADIESGGLHHRVRAILSDLDTHRKNQAYYRQRILLERDEFEMQVKAFFFSGTPCRC